MNLRDKILKSATPIVEQIKVDEWGDDAYCKILNAKEALEYYEILNAGGKPIELATTLVSLCLCDKDGNTNQADAETLSKLPQAVMFQAYKECCRVNGIDLVEKKE